MSLRLAETSQDKAGGLEERGQIILDHEPRCAAIRVELDCFKATVQSLKAELNLERRLNATRRLFPEASPLPVHLIPPRLDPALPVLSCLDTFEESEAAFHLIGWAFCPVFDASKAILQLLFEIEDQCFVFGTQKRQRPDVAAYFANHDFSEYFAKPCAALSSGKVRRPWFGSRKIEIEKPRAAPLTEQPAGLEWCGFEGWVARSSLPSGPVTLHVRITEGKRCAGVVIKTVEALSS